MKHIHARILAAWIIDLIRVGKDYEVRNLEITDEAWFILYTSIRLHPKFIQDNIYTMLDVDKLTPQLYFELVNLYEPNLKFYHNINTIRAVRIRNV